MYIFVRRPNLSLYVGESLFETVIAKNLDHAALSYSFWIKKITLDFYKVLIKNEKATTCELLVLFT